MTNLRSRRATSDEDTSPKASNTTPKKMSSKFSTTPKTGAVSLIELNDYDKRDSLNMIL